MYIAAELLVQEVIYTIITNGQLPDSSSKHVRQNSKGILSDISSDMNGYNWLNTLKRHGENTEYRKSLDVSDPLFFLLICY